MSHAPAPKYSTSRINRQDTHAWKYASPDRE